MSYSVSPREKREGQMWAERAFRLTQLLIERAEWLLPTSTDGREHR